VHHHHPQRQKLTPLHINPCPILGHPLPFWDTLSHSGTPSPILGHNAVPQSIGGTTLIDRISLAVLAVQTLLKTDACSSSIHVTACTTNTP
jgi:hypothetical protein